MIEQIRSYLAANYPASVEGENHRLDESGNITAWGFAEFGPPPTREQMLATPDPVAILQEQLDQLELARAASIRQLRAQVAAALLANGWSQPDTMAAGRDFFASQAADIYGYVSGAAPAFAAAVQIDGREWLDLPAGGGLTIRELFAEALG